MDNRNKGLEKKIFKISICDKSNQCQGYGHIVVDCTTIYQIALINGVLIIAYESESSISSEITLVIKEFSVVPSATTAVVLAIAVLTNAHSFPFWLCCRLHLPLYHLLLFPLFLLLS